MVESQANNESLKNDLSNAPIVNESRELDIVQVRLLSRKYRFRWFGFLLTDRELAFCFLVAIAVSLALDLLGYADTRLLTAVPVFPLSWWLPGAVAGITAKTITHIHKTSHPGCLFLKLQELYQQYLTEQEEQEQLDQLHQLHQLPKSTEQKKLIDRK